MTDSTDNTIVPETPVTIPSPPQNSLISKLRRLPPEIHRLPSCGLLYKNDELSPTVKDAELEFFPMTALDELDLKSPDMLLDGRAITRVLGRCVPGIQKPLDLYARDLDFIMIALRKVAYGDIFEATFKHDCEGAKEHNYNVSLTALMNSAKVIDPTTLASKYTVTVGSGDISYKVTLRPLRAKHAIDLIQSFDDEKTEEDRRSNLFAMFIFSINDVDGITDTKNILEWLEQIPVQWIDPISKRIEEISNWGTPHEKTEKCKDCGQDIKLMVNVNPLTFFI